MSHQYKKRNKLTQFEQKQTGTFKLMTEKIKTLEKSLKITQDELEKYRDKYHEADKNNAIHKSRSRTVAFHEVLKFILSTALGGFGVNLLTNHDFLKGSGCLFLAIILYAFMVYSDNSSN